MHPTTSLAVTGDWRVALNPAFLQALILRALSGYLAESDSQVPGPIPMLSQVLENNQASLTVKNHHPTLMFSRQDWLPVY